jgi:metallo-beta-lactamase class B
MRLKNLLFVLPFLPTLSTTMAQTDSLDAVITPLTFDVFVHTSFKRLSGSPFPSNGLIVRTSTGMVLIDNAWDERQARQVIDWARTTLDQPVVLCVVTHAHDDRYGGYAVLDSEKIPLWSTQHTAERSKISSLRGILPNDTLIRVGDTDIEIHFPGAGHAPDNIVVWLPSEKILFGGCLIKSSSATHLGNIADADLDSWPAAIQDLLQRYPDARWIVPGHHNWSGRDALARTLQLLRNHSDGSRKKSP